MWCYLSPGFLLRTFWIKRRADIPVQRNKTRPVHCRGVGGALSFTRSAELHPDPSCRWPAHYRQHVAVRQMHFTTLVQAHCVQHQTQRQLDLCRYYQQANRFGGLLSSIRGEAQQFCWLYSYEIVQDQVVAFVGM